MLLPNATVGPPRNLPTVLAGIGSGGKRATILESVGTIVKSAAERIEVAILQRPRRAFIVFQVERLAKDGWHPARKRLAIPLGAVPELIRVLQRGVSRDAAQANLRRREHAIDHPFDAEPTRRLDQALKKLEDQ